MARPNKKRFIGFNPNAAYFKPRGIPIRNLREVHLTMDECEAIRLADLLNMSHEQAGREMGISRPTFGRIVGRARKIVADALINGLAIRIEGGRYPVDGDCRIFLCENCRHQWKEPFGSGRPKYCPECKEENVNRV